MTKNPSDLSIHSQNQESISRNQKRSGRFDNYGLILAVGVTTAFLPR